MTFYGPKILPRGYLGYWEHFWLFWIFGPSGTILPIWKKKNQKTASKSPVFQKSKFQFFGSKNSFTGPIWTFLASNEAHGHFWSFCGFRIMFLPKLRPPDSKNSQKSQKYLLFKSTITFFNLKKSKKSKKLKIDLRGCFFAKKSRWTRCDHQKDEIPQIFNRFYHFWRPHFH